MKEYASEKCRHIVVRGGAGDVLPDAIGRVMENQAVVCGWFRASGVLTEVEIRAYGAGLGRHAATRRIAGPVEAVSIEGGMGLDRGAPSVGMRAVLARETESGIETIAGELVSARVVALEGLIISFEDLALGRSLDPDAHVTLLGDPSAAKFRAPDPEQASPKPPAAAVPAGWADAVTASAEAEAVRPAARGGAPGGPIPQRIQARAAVDDGQTAWPDSGDVVEHFAFGRCDVMKSDGDRLVVKVNRDGRLKEIAIEMLKCTELESNGPHKRFKLDRKM